MAFHIYIASHQGGLQSLPLGKIGSDAAVDNVRCRLRGLRAGQICRQLLVNNRLHLNSVGTGFIISSESTNSHSASMLSPVTSTFQPGPSWASSNGCEFPAQLPIASL